MITTKLAGLGGTGGETEFEQAFSSLAYAYLRDKAPRLLDHMIGFQLVDRNEDNTKAMGVFGFQIGSQWLYAPVFFLNGDLKGHELLFIKNNDSFVPLKENWVNYVMSRKPHILGEASAHKLRDLGGIYPDIRTLSIPPSVGGGKRASDNSWFEEIKPMLAAFKLKAACSLYPTEKTAAKLDQKAVVEFPGAAALVKVAQNLDFNNIMPQHLGLMKFAFKLTNDFPVIKQAFDKFYGKDCFVRWALQYKEAAEQNSVSILGPAPVLKQAMTDSLIPEPIAPPVDHIKSGELKLYVAEHVIENKIPELDDKERERLLNDTVLIKDHRNGEQVSRVYNTQIEAKLTNPSETALYRVLERPGKFSKMLVAMGGLTNKGKDNSCTVIRLDTDADNKAYLIASPTRVFADQICEKSEWNDWFETLSDKKDLKEGGMYLGINDKGESTLPFRVRQTLEDNRYKVDFKDYPAAHRFSTLPRLRDDIHSRHYSSNDDEYISTYDALLCIGVEGRRGTKAKAINGELRLPDNFKFITLKKPPKPKQEDDEDSIMPCCAPVIEEYRDDDPIALGYIDDIQLLFQEKTAGLSLYSTGTDIYLESVLGDKWLSKKAALLDLIANHGLREDTAREIIKEADAKKKVKYRIEYVPGYGNLKQASPLLSVLRGGPDAQLYDDMANERSVEQYGPSTAAETQYGSDLAYRLNHLSAEQTDPSVWDNWQNFEARDFQQSARTAQQAAASGQKEIFDVSMLSGMLKNVRQDSIVDKHLGTLFESLDALGRLLFNFYWHNAEFEDRYGKSDLPELEDGLRNAFETLGDITLFLKEKSVQSPFDMNGVGLDESARN